MKKLLLFLLFPLFAFAADIPLTPYIYKESGQFINITNFWVGNSNAINAVVTHPASGVTTNYPVNISGSSIDWTYPIQSKSCSGATTFTFSNTPSDTNYHTIDITLTNSTGTATVAFPATVVWVPRVAFTLDQYAEAVNTVRLMYVGGTVFGDYSQVITAVTASPPLSVSVGATNLAFSISVGTTSGTVAAGDDSRLSDARTPTTHNQPLSTITNAGTAAAWYVPAAGDATTTNVVIGTDTRLTDARAPTTHSHAEADVTGLVTDLAAKAATVTTTRGDIIARGASADERLAIGPQGALLMSDGTDPFWCAPSTATYAFTDCLPFTTSSSSALFAPWAISVSSGAVSGATAEASHPGIISLTTSTSASGVAAMATGTTTGAYALLCGAGSLYHRALVRLPTLSDGTQTYTVRSGFGDRITSQPVNGVYLEYCSATNSGKWQGWAAKASSYVGTDTTLPVTNAVWVLLEVTLAADASSVVYSVNQNGCCVSVTNSTSAQMPVLPVNSFVHIVKSAGTTARQIDVDYLFLRHTFSSARF